VEDCRRALVVVESLSPPQPNKVALVLTWLGHKLAALDKNEEAQADLERAVRIFESSAGLDHPLTLLARQTLAVLHMSLGHNDEAIAELRKNLAARLRLYPPGNPEVADARFRLGSALVNGDKAALALPELEQAVEIYVAAMGEGASQTFTAIVALGAAHESLEHWAEARRFYERAIAAQQGRTTEPGLHVPYLQLSNLAAREGKRAERRQHLETALAIFVARGNKERAAEIRKELATVVR
jgi:tetratricopeptide (TPR) repeat protein